MTTQAKRLRSGLDAVRNWIQSLGYLNASHLERRRPTEVNAVDENEFALGHRLEIEIQWMHSQPRREGS